MRNKKAWIFLESRRKYWDYSVISLCVYGNPGCREKFLQFLACEEFSVDDAVQHKGDELNEKPSVVDISITGTSLTLIIRNTLEMKLS